MVCVSAIHTRSPAFDFMKLDRNINPTGRGKYALVKMRELTKLEQAGNFRESGKVEALAGKGIVDFGGTPETDFFVIRLKDKYAAAALEAYSDAVRKDGFDPEYAIQVYDLALNARAMKGRIPD